MEALRDHGFSDDTYVLFMSDNGYMEGEHRIPAGKNVPYEESARVPLFISGPGIRKSSRSDQLVANIDMAPTILGLAGAASGRVMDASPS
jgi:arylsulfatase A-like enzyme